MIVKGRGSGDREASIVAQVDTAGRDCPPELPAEGGGRLRVEHGDGGYPFDCGGGCCACAVSAGWV